jgi:hypothetical protein
MPTNKAAIIFYFSETLACIEFQEFSAVCPTGLGFPQNLLF